MNGQVPRPAEEAFRVEGGSSPREEVMCPFCSGGNPPAAAYCVWCGSPIRAAGSPTVQLSGYTPPATQLYQAPQQQGAQLPVYQASSPAPAPAPTLPPTVQYQPSQYSQYPTQQYVQPQYQQPAQYPPYPQYQQPQPVVINNTQTVVVANRKSVGVALLLAFFFGPLGMLYSTVPGALVMLFIIHPAAVVLTAGLALPFTWLIGMLWAGAAASSYNNRLAAAYQQTTYTRR